jgi:triosephosphate isomerase (TIM)
MPKPFIAGNWKMYNTTNQAEALVLELKDLLKNVDTTEIVIAPPFTSLSCVSNLIADSHIKLSAQDVYWEKSGAFTGEVSPEMLKDVGCEYVIVGHSERRGLFHETDETVNKKIHALLAKGLKPILCIGETLEERDKSETLEVVKKQLEGCLKNVVSGQLKNIVIAYEPIWAIGTGRAATSEQAEDVHKVLRESLCELFGLEASDMRLIYGGSVKPENIDSLMAQNNIDGALIGGASLKAKDFARIVKFQPKP